MTKKILIVDDTPGWVRFHKNNLLALGFAEEDIDTAYSAKEGITKIETAIDNPYGTIFTDLQMESDFLPKSAGEWFIEQIKTYNKYYNDTNIVIISASPSISRIAKKYEVDYIPKTVIRNAEAKIYLEHLR